MGRFLRPTLIILAAAALLLLAACSQVPKQCRGLSAADVNKCIIDLATTAGNTRLCAATDNGPFRTWCYTSVANATNDTSVCDNIADARSSAFCKRDIVIARGNPTACSSLPLDQAQDDCYDSFARSTPDWHQCLNMSAGDYREQCLDTVSRTLLDPNGCAAMNVNSTGRDPCLFSLSLATKNTETCGSISDGMTRAYCLLNIVVWKREPALCDNITLVKAANTCHSLVAEAMNSTANVTTLIPVPNATQG